MAEEQFWTCDAPECTNAIRVGAEESEGWILLFIGRVTVEEEDPDEAHETQGQGHACHRDHALPALAVLLDRAAPAVG